MCARPRLEGLKVASRTKVDPFIVMDVLTAANARAAAGADVIRMEIGEPGSGLPQAVLSAATQALGRIPLGYTEALGRPQLRAAIAGHYDRLYGLAVDRGQVVVTVGASGALVLAFLAAFDPGYRVVVPEPAFPDGRWRPEPISTADRPPLRAAVVRRHPCAGGCRAPSASPPGCGRARV